MATGPGRSGGGIRPGGASMHVKAPVQTPAVSKGYSFASTWEQNAPLSEQQLIAITELANVAAERPMPAQVSAVPSSRPDLQTPATDASPQSANAELMLHNSHQFYKWYSDLEAAMKTETEDKYGRYVNSLLQHLTTCDAMMNQLDTTMVLFDDLQSQHHTVAAKTKALHDACERLVQDKEKLVEYADALRSKMNYFDELEKIASQFHQPKMGVGNTHFLPMLKRLDECISYVANNPQYADAGVYHVKFRQLQSRALGIIRSHVLLVLRHATSQVQEAVKESLAAAAAAAAAGGGAGAGAGGVPGTPMAGLATQTSMSKRPTISEAAETSLLYVRFKAAAIELKSLMEEMEGRALRKEYQQLLHDCHSLYCEQRTTLVSGVVQSRITQYARSQNLPTLTRSGCAYLMQVCQQEHQLFDHFFPASSADIVNLAPLIEPLCTILYDSLRPRFVHEADLDVLCELVDILKGEVLEEQLRRHGEAAAGLKPTVLRTLADVQERLTFRAQTFLRDEIANFMPTLDELNYPAMLEEAASQGNPEEDDMHDVYATWFPPVEKTLSCLSKLYRCVEASVFSSLAQEAVGHCSASIQRAAKVISRKGSATDGQLFLIKHLLILREQIAPFDIDFAATHKELDFSHMLDHMRRIVRGQASIFSRSNNSLSRLSPRVLESQVDAKKDLEKNLKTTCEAFIMSVTKVAVEPMLSFITKVTAVRMALRSMNEKDPQPPQARSIRDQAFASPAKVAEMAAQVSEAVKTELPRVATKMQLYLQNPSTRATLFKPIKSNILEAYGQVQALLEAEYSPEDNATVNLDKLGSLSVFLDSLVGDLSRA